MKKIFSTILVMLVLIIAFVFYMKWFNAPLAETTSNFIFQAEAQVDNCAIVSGDTLDENEVLTKLNKIEEHMNTLEDLIEIQNASTTPDQFEVTTPSEEVAENAVNDEKSEEELFEEFKAWRESNK